jgi:hypothetical protein
MRGFVFGFLLADASAIAEVVQSLLRALVKVGQRNRQQYQRTTVHLE